MGDKIYTPRLFFFLNWIFVFKSPWCEWEAATPRSHCLQVPLFRRLSAERNNSINFNYYFLRESLWWCLYARAKQTHTHSFNFTLKLLHWGTQTFEWREQTEIGWKSITKAKMLYRSGTFPSPLCTSLPKHSPSFPSLSWSFHNLRTRRASSQAPHRNSIIQPLRQLSRLLLPIRPPNSFHNEKLLLLKTDRL